MIDAVAYLSKVIENKFNDEHLDNEELNGTNVAFASKKQEDFKNLSNILKHLQETDFTKTSGKVRPDCFIHCSIYGGIKIWLYVTDTNTSMDMIIHPDNDNIYNLSAGDSFVYNDVSYTIEGVYE